MDTKKIQILGAYAIATLDSASVRGELTDASAKTMLNGLLEIYNESSATKLGSPWESGEPAPAMLDFSDPALITRLTEELKRRQQAMMSAAQNQPGTDEKAA